LNENPVFINPENGFAIVNFGVCTPISNLLNAKDTIEGGNTSYQLFDSNINTPKNHDFQACACSTING
jgi:hypothetical protein